MIISVLTPITWIRLSREVNPERIVNSLDFRPNALASSLRIAVLALPSTAGAWTATTRRGGLPAVPLTLLSVALARTRMVKVKVWVMELGQSVYENHTVSRLY